LTRSPARCSSRSGCGSWPRADADGPEELLRATYEAFNTRDIDTVLRQLAPDVDWPNAWEGGRVHGRDGVRVYWTRRWAAIDGRVEPIGFTHRDDGRTAVQVRQVVRDLGGEIISRGEVVHIYEFHEGLVTRMDVERP
jgi:ketosteroid isomerase-like protein